LDMIRLRTSATRWGLIITTDAEKIERLIRDEIDRGHTKVRSVGGYFNEETTMIFCVAEKQEAIDLKQLLHKEAPASFVIVIEASEILGRGFSWEKYYGQNL